MRGAGIPGFGATVERRRLLDVIVRAPEPVVVLAAPGGFGKSVLAAQLAKRHGGDAVWVDCSSLECSREQLFEVVRSAIEGSVRTPRERYALSPMPDVLDLQVELQEAIVGMAGSVVVLDDVQAGAELGAICDIAGMLTRAHEPSRLVVTTRWESAEVAQGLVGALVLSAEILRLDDDESTEVIGLYSSGAELDPLVTHIARAASGRVATICVLARQAALGSLTDSLEGMPSIDLTAHLRELLDAQLDDRAQHCLYACALLRTGGIVELERVVGRPVLHELEVIGHLMPLVDVEREAGLLRFRVHDIAAEVYEEECFRRLGESGPDRLSGLLSATLDSLAASSRLEALFLLALRRAGTDVVVSWALQEGHRLLESGALGLLSDVFVRLGGAEVVRYPRLLMLQAGLLREQSLYDEALHKTRVARDLARSEGDVATEVQALMVEARLQLDMGLPAGASDCLERAILSDGLDIESRTMAHGYLGLCLALNLDREGAEYHFDKAEELLSAHSLGAAIKYRVRNSMGFATAVVYGRWDQVLRQSVALSDATGVDFSLRMQALGNLGCLHKALGHTERAFSILGETIELCERYGITIMLRCFLGDLAACHASVGDYTAADQRFLESVGPPGSVALSEFTYHCACRSAWTRASGRPAEALSLAEETLEDCSRYGAPEQFSWHATLELAANLLAYGDINAAVRLTSMIRETTVAAEALLHTLLADCILAEADRKAGDVDRAAERIAPHADYILTDSANWWLGMYIRAFPHLLGFVATACDPDELSVYTLGMVLPQDAERTLAAAREVMEPQTWRRLAARLVDAETISRIQRPQRHGDVTPCQVRMFGGLEVTIVSRTVREKEWGKRKARLLFAMLILQQGKDVPRDQVYEYLWPEMDAVRARNNLYVIWSAMKIAITGQAQRGTELPYVENVGGVCRAVMEHIDADIVQFDRCLTDAARATSSGDIDEALAAYETLTTLYRGELLPGDVYDDWFSSARDRYRVEFGEAMLRAVGLCEERGDAARALHFARKGLGADAWREDLYQATMRNLIAGGQRGAAIETYLACRSRLSEDLGLDPSSETTELYQQVLAMEEGEPSGDLPC